MQEWELAVNKFLEKYINKDYFLGTMLCGSYATGNNTKNSDIDVFIVTKDTTTWRERGNIQIDGYLIEYFINPVRQVLKEFDEGFKTNSIATTRIFAGAKILHDTDQIIENPIKTKIAIKTKNKTRLIVRKQILLKRHVIVLRNFLKMFLIFV